MRIEFPKDDRNNVFDGKIHNVIPVELESLLIGNNKLYVLRYQENNLYGTTLLGKNKSGIFFKIPLDNYDYLDKYLLSNYVQRESLSILNNQDYISTIGVQTAKELFSNLNLSSISTISSELSIPPKISNADDNPPIPPKISNADDNPPIPPNWNIDLDTSKIHLYKTIAASTPPECTNINEKQEKIIKIYVGVYGLEFAVYLEINSKKQDNVDKEYKFGRNTENKVLTSEIMRLISKRSNGEELDEIHIDYGEVGEATYLVEADLLDLTDKTDDIIYDNIVGKFKYEITFADFFDKDDFIKFKSSQLITCQPTKDMSFRMYPESYSTVFLSLANSDISASFTDSYGRNAENSFSENLNLQNYKTR